MSKYLSRLKNLKTPNSPTAKTALTPLGSKGSTSLGHISENKPSSFDSEYWRQQIEAAINNAIEQDRGALEYCSHYRPDLHRYCITASGALDDTYSTKDAKQIRQAIREHDKAAEATRYVAQHPLKASKLAPDEVSRFCNAHILTKGGQCSHKGKLDGCMIWDAKNHQLTIDKLELPPEHYLDAHHQ